MAFPQTAGARIGLLSSWASRLGGGVFEALVAHCGMVRDAGFEPVVIALADEFSAADRQRFGDVEVVTVEVAGPPVIGFAPHLGRELARARLDLLHLHGIWKYPSAAGARWARATGKPYVISPHAMLDPWILGRGTLKKAIAKLAYERRSWRRAALFHALTEDEARDIRAATGQNRIAIVPNALEAPIAHSGARGGNVVYLGRIHPKKNLGGLIDGWALLRERSGTAGARLTIAGWGEAEDIAALERAVAGLGDIAFTGPAFGAQKAVLIGTARFLALPSHSEGLPMAILEAWAAGTPTIMSRHCHLPEGFADGAAFDCGTTPEEIAACLARALALDEPAWQNMSAAARGLVRTRFAPEIVARRWQGIYNGLMAKGQA